MCTNASIKVYIFRLRCLCDLNDVKGVRSLFQFWKSKIENKVKITDEYKFLRDGLIERDTLLKNVEEESQQTMDQSKSKSSDSSGTFLLQEQSTNDTYTTANSTAASQLGCKRKRRRLG